MRTWRSALQLTHHDARRRAGPALGSRKLLPYPAGDVLVDLGVRAVGLGDDDGMARIRGGADVEVQRHLAQERHAELFGFLARAAVAKDLRTFAAMRAEVKTHVLDEAQHRHRDL